MVSQDLESCLQFGYPNPDHDVPVENLAGMKAS